jgi:hypothetical protein
MSAVPPSAPVDEPPMSLMAVVLALRPEGLFPAKGGG